MSTAVSPSVGRTYRLARVSHVWGIALATAYRRRQPLMKRPRSRPGPAGPTPDAELVAAIRPLLAENAFHGEGYRTIRTGLHFAGTPTSKRRILRLTREHGLHAPHRVGRPRGPRAHDGTIRTTRVDQMPPHAIGIARGPRRWGTDLTSTLTGEGKPRSSSSSITVPASAWVSMPPAGPDASRPCSRCARPCATAVRRQDRLTSRIASAANVTGNFGVGGR